MNAVNQLLKVLIISIQQPYIQKKKNMVLPFDSMMAT